MDDGHENHDEQAPPQRPGVAYNLRSRSIAREPERAARAQSLPHSMPPDDGRASAARTPLFATPEAAADQPTMARPAHSRPTSHLSEVRRILEGYPRGTPVVDLTRETSNPDVPSRVHGGQLSARRDPGVVSKLLKHAASISKLDVKHRGGAAFARLSSTAQLLEQ